LKYTTRQLDRVNKNYNRTRVFYIKEINGRLYPVLARTSNYAYAMEVWRDSTTKKLKCKYVGISKIPEGVVIEKINRSIEKSSKKSAVKGTPKLDLGKVNYWICVNCRSYIPSTFLNEHIELCEGRPKVEVLTT
jgi:hypothetical protein